MKVFLVIMVIALQFFNLALTPHMKNPSVWLGKDIFTSILVLVGLVIGLTMLSPSPRNSLRSKARPIESELQAEYIEKMKECVENCDTEVAHSDANILLCEFLRKLGYNELVEKYLEVNKWFG